MRKRPGPFLPDTTRPIIDFGSHLVGAIVVSVSTLASVPLLWFTVQWITEHGHLDEPLWRWPKEIKTHGFAIWSLSAALTLMWPIGIHLSRLHRGPVLYLRRFGDTASTDMVSAAVWEMGSTYRMITFDDKSVSTIGHKARTTRLMKTLHMAGRIWNMLFARPDHTQALGDGIKVVAVICVILLGVVTLFSPGSINQRLGTSLNGSGLPTKLFHISTLVLAIILLIFIGRVGGVILGLATLPASVILYQAVLQVIKTEKKLQRIAVNSDDDIKHLTQLVRRFSRRALSIRLQVLIVDTIIWKNAVTALMIECGLVLVDVSDMSESILWELATLRENNVATVVIGDAKKVSTALSSTEQGQFNRRVREVLAELDILTYESSEEGRRKFKKHLRRRFDSTRWAGIEVS